MTSAESPGDKEPMGPRRVLIVDDNEDVTEMLSVMVAGEGHEVRTANLGREALDLASIFKPDLVLLDIAMPDLDGFEVCTRLRQLDFADALIVAVTGSDHPSVRQRALACGFDLFYLKPITILDVRGFLSTRRPRERARTPQ